MTSNLINYYVYIPREKILNVKNRKHRNNKFRNIFWYKNKRVYKFNSKSIKEVDVTNRTKIQHDTLYKHIYKSKKDKYFDWYMVLKPEFSNDNEIYIEKKNSKPRKTYEANIQEKLKNKILNTHKENMRKKLTVTFD